MGEPTIRRPGIIQVRLYSFVVWLAAEYWKGYDHADDDRVVAIASQNLKKYLIDPIIIALNNSFKDYSRRYLS